MSTVLSPPEARVILHNISWSLYEQLLAAHADKSSPRFVYDRGELEITVPPLCPSRRPVLHPQPVGPAAGASCPRRPPLGASALGTLQVAGRGRQWRRSRR